MIVLGLDLSSHIGMASVRIDAKSMVTAAVDMEGNHLKTALPLVDSVLQLAGYEIYDIDLLCIVNGPGYWTGLRVAVVTGNILAFSLAIPIVPISTMEVLVESILLSEIPVFVVIQAGSSRVYVVQYDCSRLPVQRLGEVQLLQVNDFNPQVKSFAKVILSATDEFAHKFINNLSPNIQIFRKEHLVPSSDVAARLGLDLFKNEPTQFSVPIHPRYYLSAVHSSDPINNFTNESFGE